MRRAGLASLLVHVAFFAAMGQRATPPSPAEEERTIEVTIVEPPQEAEPAPPPAPLAATAPHRPLRAHRSRRHAAQGPAGPAGALAPEPASTSAAPAPTTAAPASRPSVDLFDARSAAKAAQGGGHEASALPAPEHVPRRLDPLPAAPPLTPHTRFRQLERDVAASFKPAPSALRAGQVNLLQRWYLAPKGPVGPRLGNDLLAPEAQQDVGKPGAAPRGAPGLEVAHVEIDVEHAASGAVTRILLRLSSGRRSIDGAALEAVKAALARLPPTPPPEVARLGTLCSRWVLRAESLPTSTAIPGVSLLLEALEAPVPLVEAFLAELTAGACAPDQPRQIRSQNAR